MKINFFPRKNVILFQKKMEICKNVLHVTGISKVASYSNSFHIRRGQSLGLYYVQMQKLKNLYPKYSLITELHKYFKG